MADAMRSEQFVMASQLFLLEAEKRRVRYSKHCYAKYHDEHDHLCLPLSVKQGNQLKLLLKALKVYRYEHTNSRPYPRPIPTRKAPHYYSES